MTGDCNNISEQSSKPVSTPNINLHKLLNIRSLKERKKKKEKIWCFHFGGKKMFLRFNWPFVGVNRLSHMRRSGQKIQLNRSFLQQQKQILTSAVLFLSEPIKTDSDSKGFLWKELRRMCARMGVCVCVSVCADPPEHLPPLLGAHACVFILSTEGRREAFQRAGADKNEPSTILKRGRAASNCCSDRNTIKVIELLLK